MKKTVVGIFCILYLSIPCFSITDTLFWFAAPEVSASHGESPVLLVMYALEKPAKVQVSIPANPEFVPIEFTIPARQRLSYDLTSYLPLIENLHPDLIESKGIKITSTSPIRTFYEVYGVGSYKHMSNAETFSLKGSKGLGTTFYCPFQTKYDTKETEDAWPSIDIVATQNDTKITIFPTTDLVGHPKNLPFSIVLQLGQTYSARAAKNKGGDKPNGTKITSDKPISVTVKDDSPFTGQGWDLIGDQLLDVSHLGTEYISPKGEVVLVATHDSTKVRTNEQNEVLLMEGQSVHLESVLSPFGIQSSQPMYAFFITDQYSIFELGSCLLLPLHSCEGASEIDFYVDPSLHTEITVLISGTDWNDFTINNTPIDPDLTQSKSIPGTSWSVVRLDYPDMAYIPQKVNTLHNKEHLFYAFIHRTDPNWGGMVTFWNGLETISPIQIISDSGFCEDKSTTLTISDNRKVLWNTGSVSSNLTVTTPSTYTAFIKDEQSVCAIDSVSIVQYSSPSFSLPDDQYLCTGDSLKIEIPDNQGDIQWNTGERTAVKWIKNEGVYSVNITNKYGCNDKDQIQVRSYNKPNISAGPDTLVCSNQPINILLPEEYRYTWNDGDSSRVRNITKEGTYIVTAYNICGTQSDTIIINHWPRVQAFNIITPNNDGQNDAFIARGIDKGTWKLEVYNRLGQRVYQNDHYQNEWKPNIENDTYFYRLSEGSVCNEYKGWFQVYR